ncbi:MULTISPECIES: alkene reductase [Acidobacterium]|uniref:NADH-dependent oxidoreductase, oye family n=1 Tax=Acidobacterium capsulatum (strain ATCC 51196 / DSM 11244 / BCRC 80197 / JCM 7670 / NBRC 15755 / NCIMB 13165 / 161) TaxID=240015 RepID=C1F5B1_ACIC5|nr:MULTISPECIES: alkene reductase [Acidobacterium]ACO31800.1 NADH-dependent oxidoreductase, oye family [Acidobacterium capsulatum ATCC 51196]HCT59575.1 alkene reductase [Acidobacterium sp.]
MVKLFESVQLGSLVLANRIFMAPLTRNRATADGVPGELAATYYSQRASAGLIVTEATQISPMGKGYLNTPGIHSTEQVRAWSRIVESVHQRGGRVFLQLWHVGRISHTSLLPGNAQPVAPSAIRANSQTLIATGMVPVSEPVAMTAGEIKETLEDYQRAAIHAKEAGFDGVEIHAANGYLIDQFLKTGSNQRTDEFGGSASNRARFLNETVERILKVWDSKHVGVRISPTGGFNDMRDDNPRETFSVALDRLGNYGLGYLHVVETAQNSKGSSDEDLAMSAYLRTLWRGLYVVNGGYDGPRGEDALRTGRADAVSYGRAFLANPDLPRRLQLGTALNEADPTTFYGGSAEGYTTYPALS